VVHCLRVPGYTQPNVFQWAGHISYSRGPPYTPVVHVRELRRNDAPEKIKKGDMGIREIVAMTHRPIPR
jgi:hypothetical protein